MKIFEEKSKYTRSDQKITVIFKFRGLRMINFSTCLLNIVDSELSVCFWKIKMLVVLCGLFDFVLLEKMARRNCFKFKLNVQKHLKC